MEPYKIFINRFTGAGGEVTFPRAEQNPDPAPGTVDPVVAERQWEQQHPFAPAASRPNFLRGASALATAGPAFSGSSQVSGYDAAGNPIGTTGGVIPEQESDRQARLQRGASALLPQNASTIPSSLPPPAGLNRPAPAPAAASATFGSAPIRTLQAAYGAPATDRNGQPLGASGLLADNPDTAEAGGVLDLASMIDNTRKAGIAERNARLLAQQGALPTAGDSPEARASKLRYADVLLARAAAGQDLRIGQSGTLGDPGSAPQAPDGNPETTAILADIAQRVVQRGRQPRVIRAGTTAGGRPVDVLSLGNGNFSQVSDPQETQTDLGKLVRERDAAQKAGNATLVDTYNRVIDNYRSGQQERPLSLNEFLTSDSLSRKYEDDYAKYREDYARQTSRVRQPAQNNSTPEAKAMLERIRQERARRGGGNQPPTR